MDSLIDNLPIDLPLVDSSIIKVIGVGGGGGNAVNHMYRQGIADVSFVVCNTDNQALRKSPVPVKIQLGKNTTAGLGAGSKPEIAREAAEESIAEIENMLRDNTKMVFITAGMGGGTGTGASPVIAQTAHEMGILTVAIVTIPFAFEGKPKIQQALKGVAEISQHVDAILVINNEKLQSIYPDIELSNAFAKADDVLTNAAKGIAEIITIDGYINIDFADVYTIMKDGRVAIMNTGFAQGENRITKAIDDALNSPLLNTNDVSGARKVLLSLYCSKTNQIKMDEVKQIHDFMSRIGDDVQVIWGITFDDSLGDNVKITILATGFDVSDIPGMPKSAIRKTAVKEVQPLEARVIDSYESSRPQEPKVEVELKPEDKIEMAMQEFYGEEKPQEPIDKPAFPVFSIDDFNDMSLDEIENTPAWKRKQN